MASMGYPVVGIDTLRYYWQHKSPGTERRRPLQADATLPREVGRETFRPGRLLVRR
ncbi:AcvB/VirJ family lysyl-phosphatidylglycerol hydrolase [Pseudomonas aeruginosa]